jgi:hypothetical protein
MMKYIICLTIFSALLFSACTKQLDKLGPHNVTEADNLFSTEEGYQRAAEGMYALSIDAWTDDLIMIGEAGGNNLRKLQTAVTDNEDVFDYTHNRMDIWTPNYKIIQQANLIIDNVSNDETRETVLEAKAEALFCRAFAYFNLLRVYGRPYYQNAVANPGAIIVTASDDNGKRERNTVQETYQQVINDLMASIPAYTSNRGSSYANIYASYALLSRVYLYMTGPFSSPDKQYADSVVRYTTLLMDGSYTLAKGAAFTTYFTNQNTTAAATEDIFATNTKSTTVSLLHSIFTPISGTSAGLYAPSPDLLALINAEPGDLRRRQFKAGTFSLSTFPDDSIATIKYNVSGTGATTRYSFSPVRHFRLIEMYLNRAEAYAKLGNNTAALEDLNVVRNRAGLTSVDALTGQALFDAVFDQRRIELAFEGHNAFDYFRNGLTMKRSYESNVTAGITAVSTVSATEPKVILRIPLQEIELNSLLQQNEQ